MEAPAALRQPHAVQRPRLRRVFLLSCLGTDWDEHLLEHFVHHYRGLGIAPERFLVILHARHGDGVERARGVLREHAIRPAHVWRGAFDSNTKQRLLAGLQRRRVAARHWVVHADLDEFHEYPAPLADFLRRCDARGVNAVRSCLIDRVAEHGGLVPVRPLAEGRSVFEQFPHVADVVAAVKGGDVRKNMAYRGYLFPNSGGNHNLEPPGRALGRRRRQIRWYRTGLRELSFEQRLALDVRVHHFSWTHDSVAKHEERLEHFRRLDIAWWKESAALLDHVAAHGRLAVPIHRRPDRDPSREAH